jgi:hypothetical protein
VLDNAGRGILLIGIYRTANEARWLQAMITSHRKIKAVSVGIPSAFDFSYSPPIDFGRISVLLVASHNAALATNTLGHVEVKTVLLTGFQRTLRDSCSCGGRLDFVKATVMRERALAGS